ncbi:MAG TPA: radical SAM family heme chaperone HemW, partial [Verrucomicrobiae bacterium]|nr:radical SAM family heme chaperone HemW [Verrucomicrobiae bacterium]
PSYPVGGYDVDLYLQALGREMAAFREDTSGLQVSTLFVGGGTPSLLSEGQLRFLFEQIRQNFALPDEAEVTIEANPGSVDRSKLVLLKEMGVNRLSLGFQSLDEALLQRLGRVHTPGQALQAFDLAREAGFTNINVDLMNGIPGQDKTTWLDTLTGVVKLAPEHLAVYGLIIEEGTPFGLEYETGKLQLPEEEIRAEMLEITRDYLADQGYIHYEISNYAVHGKECRHNQVYWHNQPYLGFGAGAASYWQGVRRTNAVHVNDYTRRVLSGHSSVAESEAPNLAQEMSETMFLGLRLLRGVEREKFALRFGRELDEVYGNAIENLQHKGLVEDSGASVKLSKQGILLANEVFCEFLT